MNRLRFYCRNNNCERTGEAVSRRSDNVRVLLICLGLLTSFGAVAEMDPPLSTPLSLKQLSDAAFNMSYKEALTRQKLLDVTLSAERMLQISEQGAVSASTETGAVVGTLNSKLLCIVEGRYDIKESRFDEHSNSFRVDFKLNTTYPAILCEHFTETADALRCSISPQTAAPAGEFSEVQRQGFRTVCLQQLQALIEGPAQRLSGRTNW